MCQTRLLVIIILDICSWRMFVRVGCIRQVIRKVSHLLVKFFDEAVS